MIYARILEPGMPKITLMIVSLIHSLLPFTVNLITDLEERSLTKYKSVVFWVYTLTSVAVNFTVYYYNLRLIEIGRIDMKRKVSYMKMLNACIEPDRIKIPFNYSSFPLMNYLDP